MQEFVSVTELAEAWHKQRTHYADYKKAAMLFIVIDLTAKVTPQRAVAELEGLRFKRTEHRMKRYSRGASIAEAVHDGPLRVMRMAPAASLAEADPPAILLDRRWTTIADFPWTTHMDTESMLLQHTTHVTHRVTLVCETGTSGSGADSVRIEWDFASGKKGSDDHAERVDWLMERLSPGAPAASLTLTRLLRLHKAASQSSANDEVPGPEEADVRCQDACDPCCDTEGSETGENAEGAFEGSEDGDPEDLGAGGPGGPGP